MAKKKRKKENPVLGKKLREGYEKGYEIGLKHGRIQTAEFIENRLNSLHEVDGIGQKTIDKVVEHFGSDVFSIKK